MQHKAVVAAGHSLLHSPLEHLLDALATLDKELLLHRLVNALRRQRHGNGQEVVQLVALLDKHVIARRARVERLRALDVVQDVGKAAHRILVSPHHEIAEADVVVDGDLARRHTGVQPLLVELNVGRHRQRQVVVACVQIWQRGREDAGGEEGVRTAYEDKANGGK